MAEVNDAGTPRLDNCRRLGLRHRWLRRDGRLRCRDCRATPRDALVYYATLWMLLGGIAALAVVLLYFSREILELLA